MNLISNYQKLQEQLLQVSELLKLSFDDQKYREWYIETGQILDQVFGRIDSEQHPCTKAFLDYRIPSHYTATRLEMQQYYINILQYQADLLKMYLEDIQN